MPSKGTHDIIADLAYDRGNWQKFISDSTPPPLYTGTFDTENPLAVIAGFAKTPFPNDKDHLF